MPKSAKLLRLQKTKKKRKRAQISSSAPDVSQRVERLVQAEDPSSEFGPLRGFPIQRGTRIFEPGDTRKTDFAGLIFTCNSSTKQDCFRYRVFGLPEAKKHLAERIRRGMTLFLFDVDLNSLHGIYKASSPGGFNLQADAFRASTKIFPWQVRFTIYKDCAPLAENVFKSAIKDNYDGNEKFRIELTFEQVQRLVKLFQSPHRDVAALAPPRVAPLVPMLAPSIHTDAPPRLIYEPKFPVRDSYLQERMEKDMHADRPPPAVCEPDTEAEYFLSGCNARLPKQTTYLNLLSAKLSVPEYLPVRASFLVPGTDTIRGEVELDKADPYAIGPVEVKLRSAYAQERILGNRAVEVDDRYRQTFQHGLDVQERVLNERACTLYPFVGGSPVYTSISSEGHRERSFNDTQLVDHGLMLLSKRPHVQELPPRSVAYQSGFLIRNV